MCIVFAAKFELTALFCKLWVLLSSSGQIKESHLPESHWCTLHLLHIECALKAQLNPQCAKSAVSDLFYCDSNIFW